MSNKSVHILLVLLAIITILDNVNCKIIHLSPANGDILVNNIKIHPRQQEDDESEEVLSTADALAANLPGYAVGLNKVITGVNSRNPGQIFGGLFSFVPDNVRVGLNGAIDYLKPTIPTPSTTTPPPTTPAARNGTAPGTAVLTQEQQLAQQLQQFQQFQQLQQFHQFQQIQQQAQAQQLGLNTTPGPSEKDKEKEDEVDENEDEDDYEDSEK